MKACERAVACLLALALAIPLPLLAQQPAASPFRPEELEQIAAPIALYPDPLLAQVLMAATYPLEVVQAARFVQANPGLTGDRLAEALQARRWDDSVKSLVTFPQVLGMMNDKLDWTQKLGDAFLEQQQDLMDAVQRLRARAQAQGTLATTPQQTVTIEAAAPQPIIQIEPANPQVIYVPTYNPSVVYGPWPYPAYPPYYYYPPGWLIPGVFFTFGVGFVVGTALWGVCDWHRHDVHIDIDRYRRFTHTVNVEGRRGGLEHPRGEPREGDRPPWQHDPQHRRGVDYRDAVIQQRFGRTWAPDAAAREAFRGRAEQGRVELGRGWAEPPKGLPGKARPDLGRSQPRGAPRPEVSRPPGPAPGPSREPGAFQGLGRGGDVRSYSNRGRESRQSIAPPSPGIRSAPPRVAPGGGARGGAPPGGRGAPGGERRR